MVQAGLSDRVEAPPWVVAAERLQARIDACRSTVTLGGARERAATVLLEVFRFERTPSPLPRSLAAPAVGRAVDMARDPIGMLFYGLAAKAHLPASTEAFEDDWTEYERVLRTSLESAHADKAKQAWAVAAHCVAFRTLYDCWPRALRRWNRTLRAALEGATKLRVVDRRWASEELRCLLEVEGAAAISELVGGIEIDAIRSGRHCMCHGNPFLEFSRDGELVAVFGSHHGVGLRWHDGEWSGDGTLTEASAAFLASWLEGRGLERPLDELPSESR